MWKCVLENYKQARESPKGVSCDPPWILYHSSRRTMSSLYSFSYKDLSKLIICEDRYTECDGWEEEVRNSDSSCVDGKLNCGHVHNEHGEADLKDEGKVAPVVGETVLTKREEAGTADQVVGNLSKHACNEIGSLCVEKGFGSVANLLLSEGRDAVELWNTCV